MFIKGKIKEVYPSSMPRFSWVVIRKMNSVWVDGRMRRKLHDVAVLCSNYYSDVMKAGNDVFMKINVSSRPFNKDGAYSFSTELRATKVELVINDKEKKDEQHDSEQD